VGLLRLVQLVVVPAAGVLAVVELVKGVAEHSRNLVACRIEDVKLSLDRIKLRVDVIRWQFKRKRYQGTSLIGVDVA